MLYKWYRVHIELCIEGANEPTLCIVLNNCESSMTSVIQVAGGSVRALKVFTQRAQAVCVQAESRAANACSCVFERTRASKLAGSTTHTFVAYTSVVGDVWGKHFCSCYCSCAMECRHFSLPSENSLLISTCG